MTSCPRSLSPLTVALAAALLGTATAQGTASPAPSTPAATCAAGRTTLTLTSGGVERLALVYRPANVAAQAPLPVVLTLHGSESDAAEQLTRSDLERAADRFGFIVVAPQGVIPAGRGFRWNVPGVTAAGPNPPNDEEYLSDVIARVTTALCGDPARVYATGYSGGARMISQYVCDVPGVLAAIAPVAGLRAGVPRTGASGAEPDPASCAPARGVPVITFQGTSDPVNPYAGGGAPYWGYGAEAALARWAELNRCRVGPFVRRVSAHVRSTSYLACRDGATIESYVIQGGGHTWPGNVEAFKALEGALGPTTGEINANELIWTFFHEYQRTGAAR